ncbi:MAG: secretin N-terminal domain-containing protein [Pseudomonadota bacterium]|uniref:secretin N-terminal domain-containing protein n=1 Tax=Thermithiobacillus tepidarius TaxID=929 RepID=UPI000413D864|nr:secretin N-terminal domain-containing protein [Thermithiobacillus tepidarius]
MSLKKLIAPLVIAAAVSGCAGDQAYRKGNRLLNEGKAAMGLEQLQKAVRLEPGNKEYRITLARQREIAVNKLLGEADTARVLARYDAAEAAYQRVLAVDPRSERARAGMAAIATERRHEALLADAEALARQGDADAATAKLQAVLAENPRHRQARALLQRVEEQAAQAKSAAPTLKSTFKKPITLEFRDANLKAIFEVISRTAGINFLFDKDVRPDLKASLFVKNTTIEDVIDFLLVTNQLAKKVLNENSVLIYPNIPAKNRDYQELRVRTFYLANADAKQALNLIKTIVKTRDVFIDEKLNTLTMRDTPDAIRLAEKVLATQDLAEPEVLLEVEVLEVSRTRLTDLGITPPTEATVTTLGLAPPTLTLADLQQITASRVGVSPLSATVRARMENGDTNLLANPRIRVKNKEKAKVHIGERVPVITTTVTSAGTTSFLPETVNYLDVGIKLEVEPLISLDDEVSIKVGLEVSSLGQKTVTRSGSEVYRVGTRNASTTLRLRDGETQALAGLINDQERKTVTGIPGFGQIPAIGRLFASRSKSKDKTEIVLLITPHIVRNLDRPLPTAVDFAAGTDAAVGGASLNLRGSLPVSEPAPVPAPAAEQPATPPPSGTPPAAPAPAQATPGANATLPATEPEDQENGE